jgi:Flp pilus assembly protein TadD
MKLDRGWGIRGALLAAAGGTFAFANAAVAQSAPAAAPAAAPGVNLRQQLSQLAANPTSVAELSDTGRAALAVGDADAAMGFFTRALQLAPRDARAKAGLAAATAQSGRPESALVLFAEAVSLGASEQEIAADRGLAYDLAGQPSRAQQDYALSLRRREDPEVRRRMALSLAISGEREAALRLLDGQVRQGDRAGARARVMVLALSGDAAGASAAAQSSMPAGAAQAITPFLSRLASLNPGQMAAAANLGRIPSGGVIRSAASGRRAAADAGALAFAGGSASAGATRSRLPVATPSSNAPRRRPGVNEVAARPAARSAAPQQRAPVEVAASSSSPALDAGRPRGSWQSASPAAASTLAASRLTAAAAATSTAVPRLPHPHQPLVLTAAAAGAGSSAMLADDQPEPTELAGAGDSQRIPAAQPTLGSEPALTNSGVTQAASRPVQATAPVQLASIQPQASQPEPAPQQEESQPTDAAAANLAVWNRSVPPAPRQTTPSYSAPRSSAPAYSPPASAASTYSAPAAQTARAEAAPAAPPRARFSDVVAAVSSLPTETTATPAPTRAATQSHARSTPAPTRTTQTNAATRTASASTRTAAPRAARATTPANPSRVWVQLGVAPSRAGFSYEIGRMRRAAPELLQDRTPYVAPIGVSSRLLVGPFATDAEARQFITRLRLKNIQSVAWTSPAGTEVERLSSGR